MDIKKHIKGVIEDVIGACVESSRDGLDFHPPEEIAFRIENGGNLIEFTVKVGFNK